MALEDDIRAYLAQNPNASANQIAQAVGGTRQTVLQVVRRLKGGSVEPAKSEPVAEPPSRVPDLHKMKILKGVAQNLTKAEEKTLREAFGYADSEERSKAKRDAAASKILGRPVNMIDREAYIEGCRKIAEGTAKQMLAQFPGRDEAYELGAPGIPGRAERAARYAAWRFDAFQRGEVASL